MENKVIEDFMKSIGVERFTIRQGVNELKVDVVGNVKIRGTRKLPFQFGKVEGDFDCSFCQMPSLLNCPETVTGNFTASHNKLKTVRGIPHVSGDIILHSNRELASIAEMQTDVEGNLDVSNCALGGFIGFPKTIKGWLNASRNRFSRLEADLTVGGEADFSSNFVVDDKVGIRCGGKVYLSDNPVEEKERIRSSD